MLTSRDNIQIREVRKLLSDGKYRRETGLFAIEGARLCEDAVKSQIAIRTVLYTAGASTIYANQLEQLTAKAAHSFEISESVSSYLSETKTPQGVFCVCSALDNFESFDKINKYGFYLALENMQDPGNMGTIIRTAEALGMDGILLSPGCCDVTSSKVLRSSMGGVFRMKLYAAGDMTTALPLLSEKGIASYACVVDSDATPITQISFSKGSVCLIGNEGNGLKPETVSCCDNRITIPMNGRSESLNASMAAGIVLWEMARNH